MPSCTASCQLARVLLQLAFVLHSSGQGPLASCLLVRLVFCLLAFLLPVVFCLLAFFLPFGFPFAIFSLLFLPLATCLLVRLVFCLLASCFPPACCLLPSCFLRACYLSLTLATRLLALGACCFPFDPLSLLSLTSCFLARAACSLLALAACGFPFATFSLLFLPLAACLLACPSCLLPSCFLPACCLLPSCFLPACAFCDLLSCPYSCNWLACSCSLLFSLCASFFAVPYFLLSACLCLLRYLLSFPYSCCFPLPVPFATCYLSLTLAVFPLLLLLLSCTLLFLYFPLLLQLASLRLQLAACPVLASSLTRSPCYRHGSADIASRIVLKTLKIVETY